jgi:hypothetical protein
VEDPLIFEFRRKIGGENVLLPDKAKSVGNLMAIKNFIPQP